MTTLETFDKKSPVYINSCVLMLLIAAGFKLIFWTELVVREDETWW